MDRKLASGHPPKASHPAPRHRAVNPQRPTRAFGAWALPESSCASESPSSCQCQLPSSPCPTQNTNCCWASTPPPHLPTPLLPQAALAEAGPRVRGGGGRGLSALSTDLSEKGVFVVALPRVLYNTRKGGGEEGELPDQGHTKKKKRPPAAQTNPLPTLGRRQEPVGRDRGYFCECTRGPDPSPASDKDHPLRPLPHIPAAPRGEQVLLCPVPVPRKGCQ